MPTCWRGGGENGVCSSAGEAAPASLRKPPPPDVVTEWQRRQSEVRDAEGQDREQPRAWAADDDDAAAALVCAEAGGEEAPISMEPRLGTSTAEPAPEGAADSVAEWQRSRREREEEEAEGRRQSRAWAADDDDAVLVCAEAGGRGGGGEERAVHSRHCTTADNAPQPTMHYSFSTGAIPVALSLYIFNLL